MTDKWMIKSATFGNCNCAANCGCQFNLPSTHGHCQFVEAGHLEEGYFNDISLAGLNWAFMIIWPGEIAEGNGLETIIIDERADDAQREALRKIMLGEVGEPGTNHFFVFNSTCTEVRDPIYAPINYEIDIEKRTASLEVPGMIKATGFPMINAFNGDEFHIALNRSQGSFEFTHAEIGAGTAAVTGPMAMAFEASYAQFCIHHYDQDGLVRAA
ncbi:MAG: DUF1326 domain-containing protein [Hyphomicrobiales bacterium]